jgi:cytochrome P450
LHPLSSWPGPKLAALSKLYEAYLYKTGTNAAVIRELHRKHGDFLRTGPNEVAINNVEALKLFSRQTYEITRGPFYEFASTVDAPSVLTTRDAREHRVLRSIWDQGFKSTAISEYSPRVEMHVDRFIKILEQTQGKFVDCVPLISNMTFDM